MITPALAPQWNEIQLTFTASDTYTNPYTDVEMVAAFVGPDGQAIRRSAFWDGEQTWRVRFASPLAEGTWTWQTVCSNSDDGGLHGQSGTLEACPREGDHPLLRHGLLQMSPGRRNVIHADGTPFLMVADTPWALPFRGTPETVQVYAEDRQQKGFNAALLMTVQPDQNAVGPRDRTAIGGFGVGFEDLSRGHLNEPNAAYFQMLDRLVSILVEHGIVPVYQPVFHGYGWKGLDTLGRTANPAEYARYCRYLVARYGARPVMWLVGGDRTGYEPSIAAGGRAVEAWDDYRQPTGIHYNPSDRRNWRRLRFFGHRNRAHQAAEWLDFQWCQTGHGGQHMTHKVAEMYTNRPTKAVANGEPTYERMRHPGNAAGWWQGEEAWRQLMAGGTMGVVYGAAGLWQWKLFPDEPGWHARSDVQASWRDALEYEGSTYVGFVSHVFEGLDFTDIEKRPDLAGGQFCLAKPGRCYVSYLDEAAAVTLSGLKASLSYRWFDPRQGTFTEEAVTEQETQTFSKPGNGPWVLVVR